MGLRCNGYGLSLGLLSGLFDLLLQLLQWAGSPALSLLWQLLQFGPPALGGDGNGSKGCCLWPCGGCYVAVVVIMALHEGGASVAVMLNLKDRLHEATSSSSFSNLHP